jgi:hypothetical protein
MSTLNLRLSTFVDSECKVCSICLGEIEQGIAAAQDELNERGLEGLLSLLPDRTIFHTVHSDSKSRRKA